jgi:hypothetical protein
MGIASGMRDLTQDIASTRQDRAKRLGEIKEETSQTREGAKDLLKGFQASRQELKAELKEASAAWQELTRGVKKAAVKATPKVVRAEVEKAAPVKVGRTKKWPSQQE